MLRPVPHSLVPVPDPPLPCTDQRGLDRALAPAPRLRLRRLSAQASVWHGPASHSLQLLDAARPLAPAWRLLAGNLLSGNKTTRPLHVTLLVSFRRIQSSDAPYVLP